MLKKLLITFGCSWTYGVGVAYNESMTKSDLQAVAWDPTVCANYSFRGILCQQYGFVNKNFANGGSSNTRQIRLAKTFFNSDEFYDLRHQYDSIVVLWGITSTARNELYSLEHQRLENFFYNHPLDISKAILKYSYNHEHEVFMLAQEMAHWNKYFKLLNIKNFWFDTFNHHDYTVNSPAIHHLKSDYKSNSSVNWPSWDQYLQKHFGDNSSMRSEILDTSRFEFAQFINTVNLTNFAIDHPSSRDLMSQLAIRHGLDKFDSNYHMSNWSIDTNRVDFLVKKKLLNPHSHHPTKEGHLQIADMISDSIGKYLQD
jgi:hypothetical protein